MADEYIRKQDAVNACQEGWNNSAHDCVNNIKALNPADVVPVVRGRWIKTADGAECENCGREAVYQIVDDHWEYEPWCPHCGARMDGEE